MRRLDEPRLLQLGAPACAVGAALLALAGGLAGAAGAKPLSLRLGIFAAVSAIVGVILNRRAAAVARYRRLDGIQRAGLLADLRVSPPLPVTVSAVYGDDEAQAFARELLSVLREAEWPAHGVRLDEIPGNASNSGLIVAVSPFGDELPKEETHILFTALERIGLAPVTGTSNRFRDNKSIELFVGRRV